MSSRKEPFIELVNVSLSLPTFLDTQGGRLSRFRLPRRVFTQVLDGVTLDISSGERVALVGRNGAGKSTLLNVLSGVFPPSSGSVRVQGEARALLNVGLGFNYEATLTENILLRCAAMGQSLAFARSIIDDVLEFAELRHIAGRRLSTLSAGQRMRLGFAISTQVQPEILLLDEWIGTGDESFIKKAKARMKDRVEGSGIVVLASHNQALLRDVCTRAVVIELGQVIYDGPVDAALKTYRDLIGVRPPAAVEQVFVGQDSLAMGGFFGLRGAPIEKLFENITPKSYGVTFVTPLSFERVANTVSVELCSKGFEVIRFEGAGRIDGIRWSGPGAEVRLSLKGSRSGIYQGGTVALFVCHLLKEAADVE